jgi:enterochelin esterase-like enzyme
MRSIWAQIDGMPQPVIEMPAPQRSAEYDIRSDRYARFRLDEILPEVSRTVNLRQDAKSRAVAGSSSGANCAFTTAWERPDAFSKVLAWCGSFTNLASIVESPETPRWPRVPVPDPA